MIMFRTKSVPPIVMIVREPNRASTGARNRLTRIPIASSVTRHKPGANMNVRCGIALIGAGVLLAQSLVATLDVTIDEADIRRASAIATSSEQARSRFHELYAIPADQPALERLEVITEFRRFVMETERQNALGNWMMARGGYDSKGRTLKDILLPLRGQVVIRALVRLHPLNTYSTAPAFDIALGDPPLLPLSVTRTPVNTATPKEGSFVSAAIIEATFNAPSIGNAILPVQVTLDREVIGRARVDFSRVE